MDTYRDIPRWNIWEGILIIGTVVGAMYLFGLLDRLFIIDLGLSELSFFFFASLVQTLLLVGLPILFVIVLHQQSRTELGLIPRGFSLAFTDGIIWGIKLFLLVIVIGIFITIIYPIEPEMQDFAKIILMAESPWELLLPIIMGVVLAPIGEEVYFRGFLYPVLRKRWGVTIGIVLTSLFFAFMHFDLVRLIPIMVGGAGLTWLYEKTGNLWTNIIAHAVWNGIMIALLLVVGVGTG